MHTSSICVTSHHDPRQGVVQPLSTSSSYYYVDEGPQPYPRYFNTPNQVAVADRIARLEQAESGLVFSSGMAAISTTLFALLKPGDHVVMLKALYGGTHDFVVNQFNQWGVEYDFASTTVEDILSKCRPDTKLIYVESPTNPCLEVLDLDSLATTARQRKLLTICDNTFASPINQRPLTFGLDLVVHSGTKYLGGHSDLSCGAVIGSQVLIDQVTRAARRFGGNLGASDCHLLDRSLKTLDVRVTRQNENAGRIAAFLEAQPQVKQVHYPGLASHPNHALAARQMSGCGGMLSFELQPDLSAVRFLQQLQLAVPAMSLGGVDTTLCIPARTSHAAMPADERAACGVSDQLLRVSAGLEHEQDLIADFDQALHACARPLAAAAS